MCGFDNCTAGQVCNPITGECDTDPCVGIDCPAGQVCDNGNCWNPGDLNRPDAGVGPQNEFVTPGGGGCSSGGGGAALGLILAALGLLWWRRRDAAEVEVER
jgi:uncharacterized protein (TIGR03382 family)